MTQQKNPMTQMLVMTHRLGTTVLEDTDLKHVMNYKSFYYSVPITSSLFRCPITPIILT